MRKTYKSNLHLLLLFSAIMHLVTSPEVSYKLSASILHFHNTVGHVYTAVALRNANLRVLRMTM